MANLHFYWLFIHVSFPLFNVSSGSGGNKNAPELDPSGSNNSKQFQTKPKVTGIRIPDHFSSAIKKKRQSNINLGLPSLSSIFNI